MTESYEMQLDLDQEHVLEEDSDPTKIVICESAFDLLLHDALQKLRLCHGKMSVYL